MANIINFIAWLIPLGVVAGSVLFVCQRRLSSLKDVYEADIAKRDAEESQVRAEVSSLLERLEGAESTASQVPGLKSRVTELCSDLEVERARLKGVASIDEAVKSSLLKSAEEVATVRRESSEKEIAHNEQMAVLRLELASLQETVRQKDLSLAAANTAYREQGLALKKVYDDYQEAVERLRGFSSASLVIKRSKGVRASGVMTQNRKDFNQLGA